MRMAPRNKSEIITANVFKRRKTVVLVASQQLLLSFICKCCEYEIFPFGCKKATIVNISKQRNRRKKNGRRTEQKWK